MVGCHATEVLSARQLREAVDLLAATFADDPALHYVFRTGYGRRFVLPRMYRWLLSVARRDGWIVGIQNSDHLGGVAVWLPTTNGLPPAWHRAVVPALSMLPVYLFEPAAAIRVNWADRFLKRLLECLDEPCVYLAALAVREDLRGHGMGAALVRDGSVWAARRKKRIHLHCWSSMVAYYKRLGFNTICTGTLEGIADTCHGMLSASEVSNHE